MNIMISSKTYSVIASSLTDICILATTIQMKKTYRSKKVKNQFINNKNLKKTTMNKHTMRSLLIQQPQTYQLQWFKRKETAYRSKYVKNQSIAWYKRKLLSYKHIQRSVLVRQSSQFLLKWYKWNETTSRSK